MPPGLKRKYAYAELMGPRGPVVSERLILGLVLFGPKCTFPVHSHDGITESYVCLSGVVSENDAGFHLPFQTGARFSANALNPSRPSSL